jgi:hypothetical protein
MLTAGPRNRIGPIGPKGPKGPPGLDGPQGIPGNSPEYQWRGTEIRFKKPDNTWGKWTDLRGPDGKQGKTGLGMMGPQGPAYELPYIEVDPTVVAGDFVYVFSSDLCKKITVNSSAQMHNGVFGLCANKVSPTSAQIQVQGITTLFSGMTPGLAYFISVSGGITSTPPTTDMVQQVGIALSSTNLLLNFMQPMRRA